MIQRYLLILSLTLGFFARSSGQVVINEFCVANYTNYALSGSYEDWVEFYNPGASAFNLSGYFLSDDPLNPTKYTIPAGVSVPANGYKIILLSGTGAYDPTYLGQTNTNFKITQTAGESIVFSTPTSSVLESYSFNTISPNQANHSWGRNINGGPDWTIHTSPTPGAGNSGATGTAYAVKPQMSLQAGYYSSAINVTITTTEPNATIYYTLDGSVPTTASNLYTGPVGLSTTTPLRAIAISSDPNILPSFLKTNTYFFGADQHTVRVVEITGPTLGDGYWSGSELTTIEVFAPDGTFIEESHGDSNEHGNDSNAYPQKGFDYITRDELGYDNAIEYPLFHISPRPSYQRVIFKAAANDNYPSETGGAHVRDAYVHQLSIDGNLELDERKTEHCIVYINGVYWGVYEMREKMDDTDFTNFYYNQPNGLVDMLKTWGGTWAEYGSATDWNALVAFITSNDMTVQANYDYVTSQLNTLSLIDYFILNGYVVCTDWLNWNTQWWRGRNPAGQSKKWKYTLWDDDATFGHYINYTGVASQDPTAAPCQIESQGDVGGQGHIPVLNALFNNDQFTADYVQRYAALSNTIFSCERMTQVLDSMIAVIEPEMNRHTQRWGGTVTEWQNNVQAIRDFIAARCNTQIIGGLESCYNVTAYNVTIEIDGVGHVLVGTMPLNESTAPFTGVFFADLPISLEVPDGTCGTFAGWEITSGTGTIADPANPLTSFTISGDVTLVAHFVASTGQANIVTTMSDVNAGTVSVNGVSQMTYPQTNAFTVGDPQTLSVTANEWYTFDHWDSQYNSLSPNDNATTVTFNSCISDTITAVFTETPHATLTVLTDPIGVGSITMNGTVLTTLPYSEVLLANEDYTFIANPVDQWTTFLYWTVNHSVVTPNTSSNSITLHLMQNDTLIAHYLVLPHYPIEVILDPPYAGTVKFGTNYSTSSDMVVEMQGAIATPFQVFEAEYFDFKGWETIATPISPSETATSIGLYFMQPETVIAHFERQIFSYYIPNSFTPNNDGVNDVFQIEGNAIDPESFHLEIFNRWGEKVFETTDMSKAWEGDMKGGAYYVKDEIYAYRLKLKSVFDSDFKELTGTITVFR